jgi:5-formyltetrahydrofolate cyclo-ligase
MAPDKKNLRAQMLARLRENLSDREFRSQEIQARILALAEWEAARTVALFASLPSEPDMGGVLASALAGGKRVVLPRIQGQNLEWIRVEGTGERVRSTQFTQLEEPTGTARLTPGELDLVLVPGLAFGFTGERLGRGGGYYDRALAEMPTQVARIGVCFGFQLCAEIPREAHDQTVHRVLSDSTIPDLR